jgi:hypothetical protein
MHYAIYINEDHEKETWSGPCETHDEAMLQGERLIMDTYGSRSPKCSQRLVRLSTEERKPNVH